MKIIIAAATRFEIREEAFTTTHHQIDFLYTGVGMVSSAVSFSGCIFREKPDVIIQAGIAGAIDKHLPLSAVVAVQNECIGDMGVWEGETWQDVMDMGFQPQNETPFSAGRLPNHHLPNYNLTGLPLVNGVTVNEITTSPQRMAVLESKYGAQVETMEGASLHYVCGLHDVPFLQIRSLSNYVGERDKTRWTIHQAIQNLNEAVAQLLSLL